MAATILQFLGKKLKFIRNLIKLDFHCPDGFPTFKKYMPQHDINEYLKFEQEARRPLQLSYIAQSR